MEKNQWDVIILKPTFVFLSFLATQLPEIDLPDLRLLQTDTTAYAIPKKLSEEETLDEIERHFPKMFRNEICRWIGDNRRDEIEASFLDFLCCFKFELHSHIVLMEPSITTGQQVLSIKPRSVLLKWIKSSIENNDNFNTVLQRVNWSSLVKNSTIVVKNFKNLLDVKQFIKHYYYPIYKAEMSRMCDRAELWPVVDNFQKFNHYFVVEIHSKLIHLN